ncbi:MAG: oligosaccharide flippase family protein, partial [Bacteroidales bacterium]|nr:oligosaccharide flippase family protein [Bacteroidales bacterium]
MSSNPLKKLAGETAIYGFSTIFARIVNFIFFPIYTYKLTTENYGIATEFLAYIAILQVVLTLGLETGCFRFANKESEPNKVFSNALLTTGMLSLVVFLGLYLFSEQIATWLGYGSFRKIIVYVAGTLALDSFTSILFAKLRFENRPVKFAILKSIKISCEIIFNLALFFIVPI